MKYPIKKLGEIFEISSSKRVLQKQWQKSGVPFYRAREIVQLAKGVPVKDDLFISEELFDELKVKFGVPEAGDILVSAVGTLGACYVVREQDRFYFKDASVLRFSPKEGVDTNYISHAFRSNDVLKQVHAGSGSTVGTYTISRARETEVSLPSLGDQKRIAAILDKADAIRRKRQQALQLTDDFLRSTFLKMFGDPESEGWEMETLDDMLAEEKGAIRTGPFGSQLLKKEFTTSGIAVLGIDNAVSNTFQWRGLRFISEEKYKQLERYTVKPGDVLVTIMGTCGRCAIVPPDIPRAINTKHLCCMTLDPKKCLPDFLHAYFLNHPTAKKYLGATAKGAIMDGLNMGIIKGLPIPRVPIHRQEQYALLAHRLKPQIARCESLIESTESLFKSLQQKAFTGKL